MSKGTTRRQRSKRIEVLSPPRKTRRAKQNWKRSLQRLWKWIRECAAKANAVRPERKLKLVESVSLGEKPFVAVVQFEGERFLVGGAAGSISLLARLDSGREFASALEQVVTRSKVEPTLLEVSERLAI